MVAPQVDLVNSDELEAVTAAVRRVNNSAAISLTMNAQAGLRMPCRVFYLPSVLI